MLLYYETEVIVALKGVQFSWRSGYPFEDLAGAGGYFAKLRFGGVLDYFGTWSFLSV